MQFVFDDFFVFCTPETLRISIINLFIAIKRELLANKL